MSATKTLWLQMLLHNRALKNSCLQVVTVDTSHQLFWVRDGIYVWQGPRNIWLHKSITILKATIDLWSANPIARRGYSNYAAGKKQTCWLNIRWKPWPLIKVNLIWPRVLAALWDVGRLNCLTQHILATGARGWSGLVVLAERILSSVPLFYHWASGSGMCVRRFSNNDSH